MADSPSSETEPTGDRFTWRLDPERLDESLRGLGAQAQRLWNESRHTKVRLKYRGKAILPDVPLPALLAAEGVSLWLTGPLRLLLVNLGVNALLEVELVHEASERVAEGQAHYADGDVDLAEAKYREALDMRPQDGSAHYHLGVLLRVTGRRDEAIRHFEEVAALVDHPDQARAVEALAKMRRGGRTL